MSPRPAVPMSPVAAEQTARPAPDVRSRLHGSALALFREHGISGTSLQMIADDLGVTKAAVYYHYRTKDDLVLGVLQPLVQALRRVVETAEGEADGRTRREVALVGLADLTVMSREVYAVYANDPSISHLTAVAPELSDLGARAKALLAGPDPTPDTSIRVSLLLSGMAGPVRDPRATDVDDATLRLALVRVGRELLGDPRTRPAS